MANVLLISENFVKNCLYYGGCLAIILVALIVMGALKSKTKKEMRSATVKKSCVKAKVVAEKLLADGNKKSTMFLASSKLLHLNKYVADAFWYAFQIADTKKDLFFDGVAGKLDALSTELVKESNNGYISEEEYEDIVRKVLIVLEDVIARIDGRVK